MIGKHIRGIRHLWRLSDFSLQKILVKRSTESYICGVIKVKDDANEKEIIYIINPWCHTSMKKIDYIVNSFPNLKNAIESIGATRVIEIKKSDIFNREYNNMFSDMILLPKTFDEDYDKFTKKNPKIFKELSSKYGVSINSLLYKELYIYTEGSKNFIQWGVDLVIKTHCPTSVIYNILIWNTYYKQLTNKLSKGTITAYKTQKDIHQLMDELIVLRNEKRVNDTINQFNTTQKKMLKNNDLSDLDKKTIIKFSKLSDVKKNNFIRKVSTIEDLNELMRQMRHASSLHFSWNKDSLMDFLENVEGIKYEIVCENENVVLLQVFDFETIKQLAKTTNWCISKNKSYWNNYITQSNGKSRQYMIFDFSKLEDDKLSIVGLTSTVNRGITSAHNFTNQNLINDYYLKGLMLNSYLAKYEDAHNIEGILKKCGIDINLILEYKTPSYEWSYNGLMNKLIMYVDEDDITVLMHNDNKLALSVTNEDISKFFGNDYFERICSDYSENQHIIFADFNKKSYDPNKLIFGIVHRNSKCEDYCETLYNELIDEVNCSFDEKITEFGLPYDIIRRPDDKIRKFINAFNSYNAIALREYIKEDKDILPTVLNKYLDRESSLDTIKSSLSEYVSFDYLNLFYDNGLTLCDFYDYRDVSYIVEIAYSMMKNTSPRYGNIEDNRRNVNTLHKPTKKEIEAFYNAEIDDRRSVSYIGGFLALMEIISKERYQEPNLFFSRLVNKIYINGAKGSLIDYLVNIMLKKIDFSKNDETVSLLVKYITRFGNSKAKASLTELGEKYPTVQQYMPNDVKVVDNGYGFTTTISDNMAFIPRRGDYYV